MTYSYAGVLPAGVSFDTATGEFTGAAAWNSTAVAVVSAAATPITRWSRRMLRFQPIRPVDCSTRSPVSLLVGCPIVTPAQCTLVTVTCWGANTPGRNVPSNLPVAQVSTSTYHGCAVLQSVACSVGERTTGASHRFLWDLERLRSLLADFTPVLCTLRNGHLLGRTTSVASIPNTVSNFTARSVSASGWQHLCQPHFRHGALLGLGQPR